MKTITQLCKYCNKEFQASSKEVKRGFGAYCSKPCTTKGVSLVRKSLPKTGVILTCDMCSKEFYIVKSKLKKSKSGLHFCCRACKDKAQSLEGLPNLYPGHYKTGQFTYRKRAIKAQGLACQDCGFDKVPEVLLVHHIDGNRDNNIIENLIVVCPTCHDVRHFLSSTGRWLKK